MYAKEYTAEELNQIGIYKIITPGGGVYIGMTTIGFNTRWKNHHKNLKNGRHPTTGLKNAFNKYNNDWALFTLEILKSWDKPIDKNDLLELEKEIIFEEKLTWIRHKNSSYTMLHGCPTGTGSVIHTDETRKRIGAASTKSFLKKWNELGINPPNTINDEELILIKIDYEKGMPMFMLKEKYHKRGEILRKVISENNFIVPEKISGRFDSYPETLKKWPIERWYFEENKTTTEIAELTGYSAVHIWRLLKFLKENNPNLANPTIRENGYKKAIETYKNKPKIKCQYCPRLIGQNVIKRHEDSCPENPEIIKVNGNPNYYCQFKDCSNLVTSNKSKTCKEHHNMVRG